MFKHGRVANFIFNFNHGEFADRSDRQAITRIINWTIFIANRPCIHLNFLFHVQDPRLHVRSGHQLFDLEQLINSDHIHYTVI